MRILVILLAFTMLTASPVSFQETHGIEEVAVVVGSQQQRNNSKAYTKPIKTLSWQLTYIPQTQLLKLKKPLELTPKGYLYLKNRTLLV